MTLVQLDGWWLLLSLVIGNLFKPRPGRGVLAYFDSSALRRDGRADGAGYFFGWKYAVRVSDLDKHRVSRRIVCSLFPEFRLYHLIKNTNSALIIQFFIDGVKYTPATEYNTSLSSRSPSSVEPSSQTNGSPSTTLSKRLCGAYLTTYQTQSSAVLLSISQWAEKKRNSNKKKTPSPEPSHRAGRGGLSGPVSAPARDSPERHKGGDRIAEGGNSHTRGR